MTSIRSSTAKGLAAIACTYRNSSERIQIACVTTRDGALLERAIFPGQYLSFEAEPTAQLEIYSGEAIGALLEDRIPCHRLGISAIVTVPQQAATENRYGFACNPDAVCL